MSESVDSVSERVELYTYAISVHENSPQIRSTSHGYTLFHTPNKMISTLSHVGTPIS